MKKASVYLSVFLVLFELSLIYHYFMFLVPSYNQKQYAAVPPLDPTKPPTCSLFITQPEAQAFFDKNKGTFPKLYQLDNDHDGKVCENLPL
jgi:hypothetical protein